MVQKIDLDHTRFREIVRGSIRRDLKKHIANGSLMARRGAKTVTIPLPRIQIPRFRYGSNQGDGVGQGQGEPGDPVDGDEAGQGQGEAGDKAGEHELEVEVSLEESARLAAQLVVAVAHIGGDRRGVIEIAGVVRPPGRGRWAIAFLIIIAATLRSRSKYRL